MHLCHALCASAVSVVLRLRVAWLQRASFMSCTRFSFQLLCPTSLLSLAAASGMEAVKRGLASLVLLPVGPCSRLAFRAQASFRALELFFACSVPTGLPSRSPGSAHRAVQAMVPASTTDGIIEEAFLAPPAREPAGA